MKAYDRKVIERCLEDGVIFGLNRSYKHTDHPTKQQIQIEVYQAVMHEIDEWFNFGDRYVDE